MERMYCGGAFCFDYRNDDLKSTALNDYRAMILNDVEQLLKKGEVILSDKLIYTGPFYFESDGMIDKDIVNVEKQQIESCSIAVFFLENGICPGTISEMVYAAVLKKRMVIFYVKDETETESTLRSPCWYPIIICKELNPNKVEVISCADSDQAKQDIIAFVSDLK